MPPRLPTTTRIDRPRSQGFHALIDDVYVRLAPERDRPYVILSPEAEAPRIDTGQSPEEFVSSDGSTFARSDFTGGEGLAFAHRADPQPSDRRRFWDSANVRAPLSDPGTPLYIETSFAWREVSTGLSSMVAVVTVPTTERVVIVADAGWEAYDDLDDPAAPTLADSGVLTGALDGAGMGNTVYVVNGTSTITKITDVSGTFTPTTEVAGAGNWARIWHAKDRLMLAEAAGGSLWEWQPGSAPVEVTTDREIDSSEQWRAVVDAGSFIAAGASNGSVYFFAPLAPDNPTLVQVSSSPMPEGERIQSMAFNQGVLLISTEENEWDVSGVTTLTGRVYTARLTDVLDSVTLIKRWDNIDGPVPSNMFTTRDSIFFTIRDGSNIEVWRFLLPTSGLFREDRFPADAADPVGMANPGQLAVVAQPDSLWLETDTATSEASWLILPAADFFTSSVKSWSEVKISVGTMPNGSSVNVLASTEYAALNDYQHPSWRTIRTVRGDLDEITVPLSDVEGRYLILQLRLTPGVTGESPQVLAVSAVGYADDPEMVEMLLPVIVSDRIERPHRKPIRSNGYGEVLRQYLTGKKGSTIDVEVYRPSSNVRGVITAVQGETTHIGRRGHPVEVLQVRVRGKRITPESQALTGGIESLGVGLLGVEPILGGVSNA